MTRIAEYNNRISTTEELLAERKGWSTARKICCALSIITFFGIPCFLVYHNCISPLNKSENKTPQGTAATKTDTLRTNHLSSPKKANTNVPTTTSQSISDVDREINKKHNETKLMLFLNNLETIDDDDVDDVEERLCLKYGKLYTLENISNGLVRLPDDFEFSKLGEVILPVSSRASTPPRD